MNLWKKYKSYLNKNQNIKSYEFSFGAKVVLFIFSIFLFYVIGYGVLVQNNSVESPSKTYGYYCISMLDRKITLSYVGANFNRGYRYTRSFGKAKECKEIRNLYNIMVKTRAIKDDYKSYKKVLKKIQLIKKEILKLNSEYSTMLLEKIAVQAEDKSILSSNSDEVKGLLMAKEHSLKTFKKRRDKLNDISDYREQQKLVYYIELNRDKIKKAHRRLIRVYPVKKFGKVLLFLIPLFFIALYIHILLYRKEKFIIARLLSSLLAVSGIFIVFHLLYFIYQIMPKVFLSKIIVFFMKLNLGFLLNYFVIVFFILIFAVTLWQIQIRAKNSKKLKLSKEKYIKENRCTNCGCQKKESFDYCPICGKSLWEKCKYCDSKMIIESNYCQKCGVERI